MKKLGRTLETSTASLTLVEPGFIEQRYRSSARFCVKSLAETRKAREKFCSERPCVVMVVIPAEVPIESSLANVDHFRKESGERSILALAVVTDGAMLTSVSKFYFMYFPQSFPVKIFERESDARTWLRQHLGPTGASG